MKLDAMWKASQAWKAFQQNHPQFPAFLQEVSSRGIPEGTDILISLTYPDGQTMKAGVHVKASDLELLELLKEMKL